MPTNAWMEKGHVSGLGKGLSELDLYLAIIYLRMGAAETNILLPPPGSSLLLLMVVF